MKHLPRRNVFVLLLGIFVALGVSLSAVQSGEMAVKMAISLDMDGGAHGGCDACPSGDDDGASSCVAACAVTAFAVLPASSGDRVVLAAPLVAPVQQTEHGTVSSLDPDPPRVIELV